MSRTSGLAERIRLRILQGELAPGELLVEPELLSSLRTTRGRLREAMRLLEGRGLLVAGEGMRVVAPDARDVAEALAVRATLEGACAAGAAERCHAGALEPQDVRAVLALGDPRSEDGALEADRRFHLALAALAGNRAADDALFRLWDVLLVARVEPDATSHAGLVEAIATGEAELARALVSPR